MAYLIRNQRKINLPIDEAIAALRAGMMLPPEQKPKGLPAHEIAKLEKRQRISAQMAPWFTPVSISNKPRIRRADVLECFLIAGIIMLVYMAGYKTNAIVSSVSAAFSELMDWAVHR